MESARWLAAYGERLANTAANAAAASAALREIRGVATSPGGEVTVTVRAGGTFDALALTPAAHALPPGELARLVVATARQAKESAAARVAATMVGYLGHGPALDHVTRYVPAGAAP